MTRCSTAILPTLLLLAACGDQAGEVQPADVAAANAAAPAPAPATAFNPLLKSEAVKDAIHRALTSGETQRWKDGALSGYAVPSVESLPNGCKTIRYTVDQQPDAPMMTINACEGSK